MKKCLKVLSVWCIVVSICSRKGSDELMKETELSISELMERLITLELKGYVKEVSRNYYIRLL